MVGFGARRCICLRSTHPPRVAYKVAISSQGRQIVSAGNILLIALVFSIAAGIMVGSATAQVLKREPAMGKLQEGERVLVDDGTCPSGQIKEVIGGNHVKVGGAKHIERRRQCIPR
jgi:hypothetical protein